MGCKCDRRSGFEGASKCLPEAGVDSCSVRIASADGLPFDYPFAYPPGIDVTLLVQFRVKTELIAGDHIDLTLPGWGGNPFSTSSMVVSSVSNESLSFTRTRCPASAGCYKSTVGTLMDCYKIMHDRNSNFSAALQIEWSADFEVLSFRAKHTIPVGTHLSITLPAPGPYLSTPEAGLSANTPVITIESSRDERLIPFHLRKMAICTSPLVAGPPAKEFDFDPDLSTDLVLNVPGDKQASVTIPPGCFGSKCTCSFVCEAFDSALAADSGAGEGGFKKPAGAILKIGVFPPHVQAQKALGIQLSVSKSSILELAAIQAQINQQRRLGNPSSLAAADAKFSQQYFDQQEKKWQELDSEADLDSETGTVSGEIPAKVLNSRRFSGQLSVFMVVMDERKNETEVNKKLVLTKYGSTGKIGWPKKRWCLSRFAV